jgi:hypothetical protein
VRADDARRRSEEAVRRIRQESGRRVEERRRIRAFSSWCALATLASGISLAALDAHDAAVRRAEEATALRAAAEREARTAQACATRTARFLEIQKEMEEKLRWAMSEAERAHIRAEAEARRAAAINAAADAGCGHHVVTPDSWRVAQPPSHAVKMPVRHRAACGGDPSIEGL